METDPLHRKIPYDPGGIYRVQGENRNDTGVPQQDNQEAISTNPFDQLRVDVHRQMAETLTQRIQLNPTPTTRELSIGLYEESLEPQVRTAVFRMNEKGYRTQSSGFFGSEDNWRSLGIDVERTYSPDNKKAQIMDFALGTLSLDDETMGYLDKLGAEVVYYNGVPARIGFVPESPDLDAITAQWNAIAAVMPDMGAPAPSMDPAIAQTRFTINSLDLGVTPGIVAVSPLSNLDSQSISSSTEGSTGSTGSEGAGGDGASGGAGGADGGGGE